MKILSFIAACALLGSPAFSQNLKVPAPSPSTTIKQDFALSSVEASYSRPGVKGRKIFGDLVPYGKVWRTGANAPTTLTFGEEVTIGGTKVPAGKYGLLAIPGDKEWTIIISKQTNVNNPSLYKESEDVVRVKAKPVKLASAVESFTIGFDNVQASSMNITISWDKTAVSFPVTADIDGKIMAQIEESMKSDKPAYFMAAAYFLESGKDLNRALPWFDKALEENPKAFWVAHNKAKALAKLGRKQEAIATANQSIALAKEANNADYVALNEKLIASLK